MVEVKLLGYVSVTWKMEMYMYALVYDVFMDLWIGWGLNYD